MAGYTICPVLSGQMSSAQWLLWPENASPLPPYTPASQSCSPLMSLCATHTIAPCPTVHPRTTSSSTSAWAEKQKVQGKGHDTPASCVSFLLSVNAGQHTDIQHFLWSNYVLEQLLKGGEFSKCFVHVCLIKNCLKIIKYFTSDVIK